MSSGGLGLHQLGRVFISEVKRRALIHAQAHERPSTVAIKRRARANYDPVFISVQLTGFLFFLFFSLSPFCNKSWSEGEEHAQRLRWSSVWTAVEGAENLNLLSC